MSVLSPRVVVIAYPKGGGRGPIITTFDDSTEAYRMHNKAADSGRYERVTISSRMCANVFSIRTIKSE